VPAGVPAKPDTSDVTGFTPVTPRPNKQIPRLPHNPNPPIFLAMKGTHLLALNAAMSALLILAASKANAQQRPQGPRINLPPPPPIGVFNSYPGTWVIEREVPVIVEKEVVKEVPAPAPTPPPAAPRKPYVIGNTYDSLPGGCMKLIEEGASYYYCGGEWYRQEGKSYKAVQREL
jgi:hypothetical protein